MEPMVAGRDVVAAHGAASEPRPDGTSIEEVPPDSSRARSRPSGPVRSFLHRQRDDLLRDGLIGAVLACLALGGAAWWDARLAGRQEALENERVQRQEVLENTRFVRQVVVEGGAAMPFVGLDLRGAELGGLDLSCRVALEQSSPEVCANFSSADLRGANLSGADMTGANLSGADLAGADLTGVNLTAANVRGVTGQNLNLGNSNLTGARFDAADLTDADLWEADLTGASLVAVELGGARISVTTIMNEVNLSEANLSNTALWHFDAQGRPAERPNFTSVCYNDGTRWPALYEVAAAPVCTTEQVNAASWFRNNRWVWREQTWRDIEPMS